MAKTTKQKSAEAVESGAKPVRIKPTSPKVAEKKAGTKSPGAMKTAPTEKTAAKKSIATKTVVKKAAPGKKVATGAVVHRQISGAERRGMIAEAAYLRGESQGFYSDEQEDWLVAEAEVDSLLIRADVIVSD